MVRRNIPAKKTFLCGVEEEQLTSPREQCAPWQKKIIMLRIAGAHESQKPF